MATRGKRTRNTAPARKARRPAPKKTTARRSPAARSKRAQAKPKQAERAASRRRAESSAATRVIAPSSGWTTLHVVWRPAIAMATLPYRMYRVYRWAEAQSYRSGAIGSPAVS